MPEVYYRTGGKQPHNLYREDPQYPEGVSIGHACKPDPVLAAQVVAALNAVETVRSTPVDQLDPEEMALRLAYAEELLSRYDMQSWDELIAERDQLLETVRRLTSDRDDDPIRCATAAIREAQGNAPIESAPAELLAERDRYREHSITLNTVAWKIAEAIGDVEEGQERIEGNPVDQAERLIRMFNATKRQHGKERQRISNLMEWCARNLGKSHIHRQIREHLAIPDAAYPWHLPADEDDRGVERG